MSSALMSLLAPTATLVGLGHLKGFKWFISSSGRACITRASKSEVYGIVYSLPYSMIQDRIESMGKLGFVIGRVDVTLGCEEGNVWVGEHFARFDVRLDMDGKVVERVEKSKRIVRACVWVAVAPSEGEVDGELRGELHRGIVCAKVLGMPDQWAEEVLRKHVGYPKGRLDF